MRRRRLFHLIAVLGIAPWLTAASHSDFNGKWTMDPARSESAHQDNPTNSSIVVIQVSGPAVVIETMRSEGTPPSLFQEKLNLKLDGTETASTGDRGIAVTGKAHWDGSKLIVETLRNIHESTVTTTYVHTLSADGKVLTIDKTLTVQHGYQGQIAKTSGHGIDIFVRSAN